MKRITRLMSTKIKNLWPYEDKSSGAIVIARDYFYRSVAKKAYAYWEQRDHAHGFAEQDWLKAEADMKVSVKK